MCACRIPWMKLFSISISNPRHRNRLRSINRAPPSGPSVRLSHASRRTLRRRARIAAAPRRRHRAAPALAFPTSIPVTFALRDMSQELEGVASCFNLVAARSRPLRERMGLSLARVGIQRNMRAFQALRVLLEDPPPEPAPGLADSDHREAVKSFDEELRSRVAHLAGPARRAHPRHGRCADAVAGASGVHRHVRVAGGGVEGRRDASISRRACRDGMASARCGRMPIGCLRISSRGWRISNGPSGLEGFRQVSGSQPRPESRRPTGRFSMPAGPRRAAAPDVQRFELRRGSEQQRLDAMRVNAVLAWRPRKHREAPILRGHQRNRSCAGRGRTARPRDAACRLAARRSARSARPLQLAR